MGAESPHMVFVEPSPAQPGLREADRLNPVRGQPLVHPGDHAHTSLQPKSSEWIWPTGTPAMVSRLTTASTIAVDPAT